MKKKSVLILVALCLVVSMFALVACNDDKAPEKEEGKLYGNVFNVIVSADSGKTYSPWLSGTWKIENDVLTLTATWQEGDKSTMLANATSGQDKIYTKQDGKFTIGVKLPSAGMIDFEIAA